MPGKRTSKTNKVAPQGSAVVRYWVQIRDLRNGSTRDLPLNAVTRIHIATKRNQLHRPTEEILQLKDGSTTLEASSLDDLAPQLRHRYPDDTYERTLHRARDYQAEERRADALNQLIKILAEAAVKEGLHERER